MPKVSSSLYVRRAKAADKKDTFWTEALRLQTETNAEIDAGLDGIELQRQAEDAAEKFLQMDERIQYLTLRIYWASGKADDDFDAAHPDDFVMALFNERERRAGARRLYWGDTAPRDALPTSKRMRKRIEKLSMPAPPIKGLLTFDTAKSDTAQRRVRKDIDSERDAIRQMEREKKRAEVERQAAERRAIREQESAARTEVRRLKAVERARAWRAARKAGAQ